MGHQPHKHVRAASFIALACCCLDTLKILYKSHFLISKEVSICVCAHPCTHVLAIKLATTFNHLSKMDLFTVRTFTSLGLSTLKIPFSFSAFSTKRPKVAAGRGGLWSSLDYFLYGKNSQRMR